MENLRCKLAKLVILSDIQRIIEGIIIITEKCIRRVQKDKIIKSINK